MNGVENIKIFLAEDEFVIREGIKNSIDWESNGYTFVGEAGDGELAFPIIQREKPDILVTDIRMPFMDGLELSRLVKNELPDTEIIILSGFEEFEYAREAIKIGVAEYLTKPISAADLLARINNVAEGIRKRREEAALREQYHKEMEEVERLEQKDLFKNLVAGGVATSSLIKMAEKVNVSISAVCYNLVLLKYVSNRHEQQEFSGSILKLDEATDALASRLLALSFDRTPEGKAYLFMGESDEDVGAKLDEFKEQVMDMASEYDSVHFFGGVGTNVHRISELPLCYEEASKAFAYRYFENEDRFYNASRENESLHVMDDDFNVEDINPTSFSRTQVQNFLKTGTTEEVGYFVDAFFNELGENAMNSNMFRQYIAMDSYFAVVEFVESTGRSKDSVETFGATSDVLRTVDDTKAYIIRIIKDAVSSRDKIANNRYSLIVNEVYKYVEENYPLEELSLNQIAAHVNFSPSHLSMVFSQETGQTLIKYITDVRINKAKELLRCTSKRSSEISAMVGYQDPHYFSYLFKKSQGITPTDYRMGRETEEEA